MADDKAVLDTLLSKIYMILNAGDTVIGAGAPRSDSSFVSFMAPGIPIAETDLTFGFNATPEEIAAASAFAELVDIIPNVQGMWTDSGKRLSEMYKRVLNSTTLQQAALSAQEKAALKEANDLLYVVTKLPDSSSASGFIDVVSDTPFVERVSNLKAIYEQELINFNNLLITTQTKPGDPRAIADFNINGPVYRGRVTAAYQKWKAAGANVVDTMQGRIAQLTGRDPAIVFNEARLRLSMLKRTDLNGVDYYFTKFLPTRFWTTDNWTRFAFNSAEVSTTSTSSSTSWGGGGGFGFGLWSFGANVSRSSQQSRSQSDASNLGISVELVRIPIRRSWLTGGILISKAWQPTAADPFVLSDGGTPPKGELPLYPTQLILARKLKIKMDMSSVTDSFAASQFSSSASIGWGPFSVRGNYSHNTSNASHNFSYNGGEIECPGMQIIGVVCQTLPKAP